jgi:hypothetical protein
MQGPHWGVGAAQRGAIRTGVVLTKARSKRWYAYPQVPLSDFGNTNDNGCLRQRQLGGAEWLAAAGAAYALNRLRNENDDDPEGEA